MLLRAAGSGIGWNAMVLQAAKKVAVGQVPVTEVCVRTTLSKLSPGGTAESSPGRSPGKRFETRISPAGTAEIPQDAILGSSTSENGLFAIRGSQPRTIPDFLHAALETSAYAAFFTESRTRLRDSTTHRKSGFVLGCFQPSLRDCSLARC
jgi:hypothetical protein